MATGFSVDDGVGVAVDDGCQRPLVRPFARPKWTLKRTMGRHRPFARTRTHAGAGERVCVTGGFAQESTDGR
jgi:hypothetical protein